MIVAIVYHRYLKRFVQAIKDQYAYAPYRLSLWVLNPNTSQDNLEMATTWDKMLQRALKERLVGNARYCVVPFLVRHERAGVIDQREVLISPLGGMIDAKLLPYQESDLMREIYIRQVLKEEEGEGFL